MSSIIKRDAVQLSTGEESPAARVARAPQRDSRASVRLLRIDGDVRAIQLGCTCGREHVIELQYEAQPPQPPAKS